MGVLTIFRYRKAHFAIALMALCSTAWTAPDPVGAAAAVSSVLGIGSGLNHISILVHDLPATEALFRDQLGFNVVSWGRFPEGLENAGVSFSDHTYLEFLAIYDPVKAASSEEAAFLRNREGAIAFGLETDSAERALALLRSRGITAKISTTTSDEYVVAGERTAPTWLWRDIDLPKETPGNPFLVEYNNAIRAARAKSDPAAEQKRALARIQPNGATRLSSVWIAVRDLNAALETYKRLGLAPGHAIALHQLSATGREITAGGGQILLLTSTTGGGPVADFLANRGEALMGVTIEVSDLARERTYVKTHATFAVDPRLQSDDYLLIPATVAHGLWVQLKQGVPPAARNP
jgi:catechol 2,3-dioxygenase-like lactoylglutathione lyase family enzyme